MFAHAVYVGDRKWNLKEALDIVVTVSEELNIVIPANDVNAAVYIDVPLGTIVEVSFDNTFVLDSQQTTYGVVIRLDGRVTTNCILNATRYAENHITLAFSSQKDANTLERLLVPTNARTKESAPHSRSGATDKSSHVLSDDGLAAPDPTLSDNQVLTQRASLDNALIPYGDPMTTINPSMLERIHPSQRASTEHGEGSSNSPMEHDEEPLIVDYSVEMATEGIDVSHKESLVEQAIESINVSQHDGLNSGEDQVQDTQVSVPGNASSSAQVHYPKALGDGKQDPIGHLDRVPDIGPSNLLYFHTGLNATEQETQSRAQPPQHAVSSVDHVINKRGPEGEDGQHDDLYYASPKVAKGHGRAARSLARDSTPKPLERPLESDVQQSSDKKGPPMKLSRQLRNADGVVELYTELIADGGLTAVTENDAIDVKTSENSWKSKGTSPARLRDGTKEFTKAGKKTQSRGKAIATEEPLDTSLEDYILPATPKRVGSAMKTSGNKKNATGTRLKAIRAQRNNPKRARPVLTTAVTGASTKESAPKVKNGTKDAKSKSPGQRSLPNRLSGKKVDDDDDAIWDIDQAHSERERESLRQPRQLAKTAKKQDVRIPKSGKAKTQTQLHSDKAKPTKQPSAHNRESVARLEEAKPAPAALSQRRPRRTAAIKANMKIQGLKESDELVDDEEVITALAPSKRVLPVTGAKTRKDQNIENGRDDQRKSGGKLPMIKISAKDPIPDSVSPDSSDKQRPDSVPGSRAEGNSEKFNTVRDAPAEALRAAPGDRSNNLHAEKSTRAADTSALPLRPGQGDHSIKPDAISGERGAELSEARVDSVPHNVPQLYDPVLETEPGPISFQQEKDVKQGHNDPDATPFAGHGDQDQADDFVPCANDRSLEIISNVDRAEKEVACPQAPTAQMSVRIRERGTSPQFAESAEKSPSKLTSTRRDPFVTKLNASMPEPKNTSIFLRSNELSGNGHWEKKWPKTFELERSSRESKAKALHTHGAVSSGKTKQVESARKRLKTAMQVDWEGKSPPKRSSKPVSEPISASGLESKRRTEEVGDTSNKRVKVVPKGRLEEVSTKRQPGFDAKKTPLPVLSNKPLVIGFSTSGPRNQGTISSKKSKTPNDVRSGTLDAAESRKHEVPNPAVDQVTLDLASNQETLEMISEDIQPDIRITDVARKEARGSPRGKQAEHIETVNAVVPGEERLQEKGAEKRKLAPFLDDPAPWEHEQHSKRQKRDMQTPPTAQKHHPEMIPDLGLALIHDRSQRLSSQNTRVNENGSPMPFFIARNESAIAEEQYSDEDDGKDALAKARLEEEFVLQDDYPILPDPILRVPPLVSAVSTSQPKARVNQSLSNNSKQVPSSPRASSAFGTMPPHHLYHDGKIVNAETKESIVPTDPQDPFLGATQKPPNAFMDVLRKSTEFVARRLGPGGDNKRNSDGVVVRPNPGGGEDPDKTLVEPVMRERHRKVRISDNLSTSTSDSSTPASQPDESPKDSEGEMEARWRKGLEPHQENMLDCLLTISHVSNYLVKLLTGH